MKRCLFLMLATAALLVGGMLVSPVQALLYGDNILADPSFETMTPWVPMTNRAPFPWSWSWPGGGGGASQSDEKVLDGDYALRLTRAGYFRVGVMQEVPVVLNRTYSYRVNCALGSGFISPNEFFFGGVQVAIASPWASGSWRSYSGAITLSGAGADVVEFEIASGLDAGEIIFWDDLSIRREIAMPTVSDDTAGELIAGVATTFSLLNDGGFDGTYNIFFDPDIVIAATNAAGLSYDWVSDTQVDVTLTAQAVGEVGLTLVNPNGDAQTSYAVTVVPEPMTMALLALGGVLSLRRRRH